MQDAINYMQTNWVQLTAAAALVVGAARAIVMLTPTPKDDAIMAKVVTALKKLGLVIPDQPKK
jgi:hypothetical protein